MNCTRPDIA
jgi:hypothetical protein